MLCVNRPLANTASLTFAWAPVPYPQAVVLHDTACTQLLIGRNEPQIKQMNKLQTSGMTLSSLVGVTQYARTWLFRNDINHSLHDAEATISSTFLVLHRAYKSALSSLL